MSYGRHEYSGLRARQSCGGVLSKSRLGGAAAWLGEYERDAAQTHECDQQASEQQTGDAAYEQIFQMPVPQTEAQFRDVPVCKLHPFFTADIGFHPYPRAKLEAFAEELKENGLYERILVRPIAGTDEFEILAGHNRTAAAKLAGWTDIPATVMSVNDQRAISIAIATNLLRRQDLTIIERGKAYKALLDARNRCGQRSAAVETFGDNRQRYNARKIVAEFSA